MPGRVKALAFHLPQFHPIPENDRFWGKGFTEWRNVVRARPVFAGHEQPRLPADLGFYDLRLPETRAEQAALAREHGIHGFCYYHYWFGGRRLLERPVEDMRRLGEPDFPYCLCWANENWTRAWDGRERDVLVRQDHAPEQMPAFIRDLFPHFADPRYIRVGGAHLLLVYRADLLPDPPRTAETWRREVARAGLGELHLAAVQSFGLGDPRPLGFDAAVEFPPHGIPLEWNCNAAYADRLLSPSFRGHLVEIDRVIEAALARPCPPYRLYRGVMPSWDNTPRRPDDPLVFVGATPAKYEAWLAAAAERARAELPDDARFVFVNAWNEWAEGCCLEPDLARGTQWLEATRRAMNRGQAPRSPLSEIQGQAPRFPFPSVPSLVATTGLRGTVERLLEEEAAALAPRAGDDRDPGTRAVTVAWFRGVLFRHCKRVFRARAGFDVWRANRHEPLRVQAREWRRWQGQRLRARAFAIADGARPGLPVRAAQAARSFCYRNAKRLFAATPRYRHWLLYRREPAAVQVAADLRWRAARLDGSPAPAAIATGPIDALAFPASNDPAVSVIIPAHGHLDVTLRCLVALRDHAPAVPFEVIVADDASPDGTFEALRGVPGLRVLRNERNLGYLHTCNAAAAAARGAHLLFLNNDTLLLPGCVDEMLRTFRARPAVGLVGAKILARNGRLQEAGGIVWNDGSASHYGFEDNPDRPEYGYAREPDYCSGACLMVPAALFRELGGFDPRFAPAYYEDTDLAFAVRARGLRVVYQPFARVIHFEGTTCGTDPRAGIKAHQRTNRAVFREKWAAVLAAHGPRERDVAQARERGVRRRALIIDAATPRPDRDSGSVDTLHQVTILERLGYQVAFLPDDLVHANGYTAALQDRGVECFYAPFVASVAEHLRTAGRRYDLVLLKRAPVAGRHIADVREHCPNAHVVFDTVDLHWLREERQATVAGSARLAEQARGTKALEQSVMQRADATIVVSTLEHELVRRELPDVQVRVIPFARPAVGRRRPFAARRDVVFVGNYLHAPNVDAVTWFADAVWPLVARELPDARFRIAGSNAGAAVTALGGRPGVVVDGYVEDLGALLEECRLSVAPLRFGAGIKGKVATSLAHGLPCVASPCAVEGMDLEQGRDVLVAAGEEDLARAIVAVYTDEALWERLSASGLAYVSGHLSLEAGVARFEQLLDALEAAPCSVS